MEESGITLNEAQQVLTSGLFLLLFTSFLGLRLGFYKLPADDPSFRENKLPLKIVVSAFFIFLSCSLVLIPLLFVSFIYLYQGDLNVGQNTLLLMNSSAILFTFFSLAFFNYFLKAKDQSLIWGQKFGPTTSLKKTFGDILMGLFCWVLAFPFVIVFSKLIFLLLYFFGLQVTPDQVAVSQVKTALASPSLFFLLATNIIFLVPVVEEFLFRGCLQTWIKGKLGLKKAILLSSFIFASFHFSLQQGLGNIELLVSLFILSCFLGFLYEKQKSLFASIFLHGFFNGITILMIWLSS